MINLNVNRVEARLNRPAALLQTDFDFYLIGGGGGGGNSSDGATGGNGGSGGAFSSGSFTLSHGVTATIDVGSGGNAPADLNNGTIGTDGADSQIIVSATPVATATGGTAANITTTTAQTGQKADDYLGYDAYGRNGSRGTSDPDTPIAGVAGGNNTEFENAWGGTINANTNVIPSPNMGGGGRGAAYDNTLTDDRAGAGADGFVSVRVYDPINAFDIDTTGTVEVINNGGYRYFYFLSDGTLEINRAS